MIHLRGGLFNLPISQNDTAQVYRLDGVRQQETTVYSPSYSDPLIPVAGSVQVATSGSFRMLWNSCPHLSFRLVSSTTFPITGIPRLPITWFQSGEIIS